LWTFAHKCRNSNTKGVFGSPGELSHLIQAECSYAHHIQECFIMMCLVDCMS
jgi:hypothetical protein